MKSELHKLMLNEVNKMLLSDESYFICIIDMVVPATADAAAFCFRYFGRTARKSYFLEETIHVRTKNCRINTSVSKCVLDFV